MEASEANGKRLKGDVESVRSIGPRVAQASAAQQLAKPCYYCGERDILLVSAGLKM